MTTIKTMRNMSRMIDAVMGDVAVGRGHRGLSESRIEEESGTGRTWAEYEADALMAFLDDVAKGIKSMAGGHAESVKVVRARPHIRIEYKGQNRSNIDMEWSGYITPGLANHEVWVNVDFKVADGGMSMSREVRLKSGTATPQILVNLFAVAFGK